MEVKEELIRILFHTWEETLKATYGESTTLANIAKVILDKHAHELAEKIRQGGPDKRGLYVAMTRQDEVLAKRLADLIDPPKEPDERI